MDDENKRNDKEYDENDNMLSLIPDILRSFVERSCQAEELIRDGMVVDDVNEDEALDNKKESSFIKSTDYLNDSSSAAMKNSTSKSCTKMHRRQFQY